MAMATWTSKRSAASGRATLIEAQAKLDAASARRRVALRLCRHQSFAQCATSFSGFNACSDIPMGLRARRRRRLSVSLRVRSDLRIERIFGERAVEKRHNPFRFPTKVCGGNGLPFKNPSRLKIAQRLSCPPAIDQRETSCHQRLQRRLRDPARLGDLLRRGRRDVHVLGVHRPRERLHLIHQGGLWHLGLPLPRHAARRLMLMGEQQSIRPRGPRDRHRQSELAVRLVLIESAPGTGRRRRAEPVGSCG